MLKDKEIKPSFQVLGVSCKHAIQWNSIFLKQFVQDILAPRFTEIFVEKQSSKDRAQNRSLWYPEDYIFPRAK